MTTNDKKSAITDSVDGQPSASPPESTNEHDETQVRQSTPIHTGPAEYMSIPASYVLKLLKDAWIMATDAAWMEGEEAANEMARRAELFSSSIGQLLDDRGYVIGCGDFGRLISSPMEKGQAPLERFSTLAFLAHVPGADPHDDPLPY